MTLCAAKRTEAVQSKHGLMQRAKTRCPEIWVVARTRPRNRWVTVGEAGGLSAPSCRSCRTGSCHAPSASVTEWSDEAARKSLGSPAELTRSLAQGAQPLGAHRLRAKGGGTPRATSPNSKETYRFVPSAQPSKMFPSTEDRGPEAPAEPRPHLGKRVHHPQPPTPNPQPPTPAQYSSVAHRPQRVTSIALCCPLLTPSCYY